MNFRCLTNEDTEINRYISSRRNYLYICVNHANKYLFSLLDDEIRDYPKINKLIFLYKPHIKSKSATYYICKQISSSNVYVSRIGRVYAYLYKPILEITRSKCQLLPAKAW